MVWARERISIQCPSSMMTISSASSHQNSSSWWTSPRVAAQEAKNATVIASAISSIIPGLRLLSSLQAPVRNGLPPQTYMTVPSTAATHPAQPGTEYPSSMANMGESPTTGAAMTRLIQNSRRNWPTWSPWPP